MNIEIFSKDACGNCVSAKNLVKQKCYDFKEYKLGTDVSLSDLIKKVDASGSKKAVRSAPQIFIDGAHIGEFKDLIEFFKTKESVCVS